MVAAMAVDVIIQLYILCFMAAAGIAIALLLAAARRLAEKDRDPSKHLEH